MPGRLWFAAGLTAGAGILALVTFVAGHPSAALLAGAAATFGGLAFAVDYFTRSPPPRPRLRLPVDEFEEEPVCRG